MSSQERLKRVFDEVHGYIELDSLAQKIISLPIFQRLRRIKQLGVAEYVYPGATHNRFSHSLGVYHLMKSVISRLRDYIDPDKINILLAASLLHDIGHLPYSHALETYYMNILGSETKINHEYLSSIVIREDPDLKDLLKNEGIEPSEISDIINGRHKDPLYNSLLSSDLDVDRMDYLIRDSLHTGVIYGSIDLRRILSTLEVDRKRRIGVNEKGLIAVENFYLARLHMYRAVYYHKTVHGYELMLVKLWERVLRERPDLAGYKDFGFIKKMISDGLYKYFDDNTIVSYLGSVANDQYIRREIREIAEMFLFRRGYKAIYDKIILSEEPMTNSENGSEEIKMIKEVIYLMDKYGIDSLYYIPVIENIAIYREDEAITVRSRDGSEKKIFEHEGSIIKDLPKYLNIIRFYVHPMMLRISPASDIISKYFNKRF